jgi:hypothetical protein
MDMKEEMMNDALDDALGDEDDEEERYVTCYFLMSCEFVLTRVPKYKSLDKIYFVVVVMQLSPKS